MHLDICHFSTCFVLLIAPEGIEMTINFVNDSLLAELLIAPEGIEILQPSRLLLHQDFLLIAPEGIEIHCYLRKRHIQHPLNRTRRN